MRKLSYLFISLFIVAALASCEQNEDPVMLKKAPVPVVISQISNEQHVAPVIIEGENNGGNITCAEVGIVLKNDDEYFDLCGEKIDYSGSSFAGEFPEGLNVTVTDGTFVSFEAKDCIEIEGKLYKVGAVIVKGSNAANIYFYPDGILIDGNLSSPVNNSGKPAGLSNLSFCFVECSPKPDPQLVLVMKTYLAPYPTDLGVNKSWAGTNGIWSENNSLNLGYIKYDYNSQNVHPIYLGGRGKAIGTISASDYFEGVTRFMKIVIELDEDQEWQIGETFLYVGTSDGYKAYLVPFEGKDYTQFRSFKNHKVEITDVRTFIIPFSEITE